MSQPVQPTSTSTSQPGRDAATPGAGPDLGAIKARQQAAWASGDFAVVGVTLQIVGETLAEAADVRAGERVIDIAAGNGNATLAAARRFAKVVSTDYVPSLLEKGRARAVAEGLAVDFREADAEALPFADASFDLALSTFGIMFAPDHARAAAEMRRVVRPGGRIAMANWTPDGLIGQLFRVMGRHIPPPAGLASPMLWGVEDHLRQLFGADMAQARIERRMFNFRYASSAHWLQVFRDYYGPLNKAFAALDPGAGDALARDLLALIEQFNTAGSGSLVAPAEYLEVVLTREEAGTLH